MEGSPSPSATTRWRSFVEEKSLLVVPGSPELVGELLPRVRDDPHGWQVQWEEVVLFDIYYIANYIPRWYSITYVI